MSKSFRAAGDTEARKKQVVTPQIAAERNEQDEDGNPRKYPSVQRQCELLGVPKSMVYYVPVPISEETVNLMNAIDAEHLENPTYGSRTLADVLRDKGFIVGRRRVRRLMKRMGIEAIYPQKNLSRLGLAKYIHPYLLRHMDIERSNQVWSIDITYIRMKHGFMYLTAIIDVYSRYIVGWRLSNTLDTANVLMCLRDAVTAHGKPEIINSDQGCQFTCHEWVDLLKSLDIQISMDGKGRCLDNHWIERFWRSLKREYIYISPEDTVADLHEGIMRYIDHYNNVRPHQGIAGYKPVEWYEYAA